MALEHIKTDLIKHHLDFEVTLAYVRDNLSGGNALSSSVVRLVDFKFGHFFTLLPNTANIERRYAFKIGEILPQSSPIFYSVGTRKASYSPIPNIREEVTDFILHTAKESNLSCTFEDVLRSATSPHLSFFDENRLLYFFDNEVFYILNQDKLNCLFVSKCIEKSNAIWHSLCVLSNANVNTLEKNLSLADLDRISQHAQLIMIGAYDGEGYIFWERDKGKHG